MNANQTQSVLAAAVAERRPFGSRREEDKCLVKGMAMMMTPIGELMIEHRLIERMVRLLGTAQERMTTEKTVDALFIGGAVDFIRNYADRCHHGKEEDILFRELAARPLEEPYHQTLQELIEEHVYGRKLTQQLAEATERYRQGATDALSEIAAAAGGLATFYPRHIEKEDRHFFVPVMDCFSQQELQAMLERFHEFDRQLIHERYRGVVSQWEAALTGQEKP